MVKNEDKRHDSNDNNSDNQLTPSLTTSNNILSLIDSFIEQIFRMKRILNLISVSAIILACLAIALSVFLLRHPSFFAILELENEFGLVLGILLGAIIIISAIWIIAGIKQYRSISSWSKRYNDYVKHKEALDRKVALQKYDDNMDPSL
jgi:predicted lysophospholipase L1 biosynthesis ABC-type transport system permease subunit